MGIRRDFLLILIVLLLMLFKPTGFWREIKQLWAQREYIVRVLFVLVSIYFLYGLYSLYAFYNQGGFAH